MRPAGPVLERIGHPVRDDDHRARRGSRRARAAAGAGARFLALAWSRERPSTQVARLAVEAGYADHAHLSREAARLEGRSPRTFLSESELRCGCGHDHSASYGPLLRHRPRVATS